MARLVWGISGVPKLWFASRLGIRACCTRGGVTLFVILGDDAQLCHAPEVLEREVPILVVKVQEFSYYIVCSSLLLIILNC